MPDTLSREELAAIRERDRAAYWSTDDDPEYRPAYLIAEEGHSYTLADRRALLAHIDALTAAVEELQGVECYPEPGWKGAERLVHRAAVLAILRGEL